MPNALTTPPVVFSTQAPIRKYIREHAGPGVSDTYQAILDLARRFNGFTWASAKTLGEESGGVSRCTTERHIRKLANIGVIHVRQLPSRTRRELVRVIAPAEPSVDFRHLHPPPAFASGAVLDVSRCWRTKADLVAAADLEAGPWPVVPWAVPMVPGAVGSKEILGPNPGPCDPAFEPAAAKSPDSGSPIGTVGTVGIPRRRIPEPGSAGNLKVAKAPVSQVTHPPVSQVIHPPVSQVIHNEERGEERLGKGGRAAPPGRGSGSPPPRCAQPRKAAKREGRGAGTARLPYLAAWDDEHEAARGYRPTRVSRSDWGRDGKLSTDVQLIAEEAARAIDYVPPTKLTAPIAGAATAGRTPPPKSELRIVTDRDGHNVGALELARRAFRIALADEWFSGDTSRRKGGPGDLAFFVRTAVNAGWIEAARRKLARERAAERTSRCRDESEAAWKAELKAADESAAPHDYVLRLFRNAEERDRKERESQGPFLRDQEKYPREQDEMDRPRGVGG